MMIKIFCKTATKDIFGQGWGYYCDVIFIVGSSLLWPSVTEGEGFKTCPILHGIIYEWYLTWNRLFKNKYLGSDTIGINNCNTTGNTKKYIFIKTTQLSLWENFWVLLDSLQMSLGFCRVCSWVIWSCEGHLHSFKCSCINGWQFWMDGTVDVFKHW